MKIISALLILIFTSFYSLNAQTVFIGKYPNELKGFELFKTGKWKSLQPYVSSKDEVEKMFGDDCAKGCDYDGNWRIVVMYVGEVWRGSKNGTYQCVPKDLLGKYSGIIFYPKKRVLGSNLRFGKAFHKTRVAASHKVPSTSDIYSDESGLMYEISAESAEDEVFNKGDLVTIHYGVDSKNHEIYKDKVFC